MRTHVLILHGPNLNLLGSREKSIYGTTTLAEIDRALERRGGELGVAVQSFQSNHEGVLVDKIQQAAGSSDGILINPGALTHYSYAARRLTAVGLLVECALKQYFRPRSIPRPLGYLAPGRRRYLWIRPARLPAGPGSAGQDYPRKTRRPELKERVQRLQENLQQQNLQALLVSHPANRQYLSGFDGSSGVCWWGRTVFRFTIFATANRLNSRRPTAAGSWKDNLPQSLAPVLMKPA